MARKLKIEYPVAIYSQLDVTNFFAIVKFAELAS